MTRRRLPSLNSLRSFEAVARNQSFTNAANELCVTQGAVSHQVKLLEEQLGIRLLERDRPKVTLTKSGEKMLRAASEAFNNIIRAAEDIRNDAAGAKEALYIKVSPHFSQFWLAPRIRTFLRENPNSQICIGVSPPEAIAWTGGDVVSIEPRDATYRNDDGELLFRSDLQPLCAPSLFGGLPFRKNSNALGSGTLLCERRHDWWSELSHLLDLDCTLSNERLYFEDPGMTVNIALAGQGWLMGSTTVLKCFVDAGQLVAPLDPRQCVPRAYYLDYKTGKCTKPLAKKFRTWLLDESLCYRG